MRSRIVVFPLSPSKSPLILIICNCPYVTFSLAPGSEERRTSARGLININGIASSSVIELSEVLFGPYLIGRARSVIIAELLARASGAP